MVYKWGNRGVAQGRCVCGQAEAGVGFQELDGAPPTPVCPPPAPSSPTGMHSSALAPNGAVQAGGPPPGRRRGAPASRAGTGRPGLGWVKPGQRAWLPPRERRPALGHRPQIGRNSRHHLGPGAGGAGSGAGPNESAGDPGGRRGGRRGSRSRAGTSAARRRRGAGRPRRPGTRWDRRPGKGRAEEMPHRTGLPPLIPRCHQAQQLEAFKVCP